MTLKQMPDVLCPNCLEGGGLEITKRLKVLPLASPIPPGRHMRFSAVEKPYLACKICEWEVEGEWGGHGDVVFPDPHVT